MYTGGGYVGRIVDENIKKEKRYLIFIIELIILSVITYKMVI